MANITVSEKDFEALAIAANDANKSRDYALAGTLDKLARKANAALSNSSFRNAPRFPGVKTLTWEDVPSTIIKEPTHDRQ